MPEFTSSTHRAEVSSLGIISVFPLEQRTITEFSVTDGSVSIIEHTADSSDTVFSELLEGMNTLPVFRAASCSANEYEYHVDYEYGASRWKGKRPDNDIRIALQRCGFDQKDIDKIMWLCNLHNHPFLTKVG
jgi:hypothetical protein